MIEDANMRLEKCKSIRASEDGFHLDPGAVGSVFVKNKAKQSGEFDLNDETPPDSCTFAKNKFKTRGP